MDWNFDRRFALGALVVSIVIALAGIGITIEWPEEKTLGWLIIFATGAILCAWLAFEAVQWFGHGRFALGVTLFLCIVVLGGLIFVHHKWGSAAKADDMEPKPTEILDPHLDAEMLIDSVTSTQTNFHLTLTNGPVPISGLAIYMLDDKGMAVSVLDNPLRNLAPGQKEDVPGPILLSENPPISLRVLVTFLAFNNPHHARFVFFASSKSQPNNPVASEQGVGTGGAEFLVKENLIQFMHAKGTIFLKVPEKRPDGSFNKVQLRAKNRYLLIDPLAHQVIFESGFVSPRRRIIQPLNPEFTDHLIAVEWDDQEHMIGIAVDKPTLIMKQ